MPSIKESKTGRIAEPADAEGFDSERIELHNGIKLGLA
jgi:hypothetical protein